MATEPLVKDSNEIKQDDTVSVSSIQIVSDLHLEFSGVYQKMEEQDRFPTGNAPILCLLGDIGYPHGDKGDVYWQFVDKMIDRFQYIIIITGNHEYYQNEYHTVNDLIKQKLSNNDKYHNKVFFLNNETLELPDVLPNIRILGSTLWVNYPKANEDDEIAIQYEYRINDFRRIKFKEQNNENENEEKKEQKIPLLTSINVNSFHKESVDFISRELKRAKEDNKDVIILSHHAPTDYDTIYPESNHEENPVGYGMNYSSMEYLFQKPLIGWFSGHTHYNCNYFVKTNDKHLIRIASNQQGYIVGYNKNNAPKDYSVSNKIVFPSDHELNEKVKIIEFDEFKKSLVDKNTLIPDGSFFAKQTLPSSSTNDAGTRNNNVQENERCTNCQIL